MENTIKLKNLNTNLFYEILLRWNPFEKMGYPKLVDYTKFDVNKPVGYEWKNLNLLLQDKKIVSLLEALNAIK